MGNPIHFVYPDAWLWHRWLGTEIFGRTRYLLTDDPSLSDVMLINDEGAMIWPYDLVNTALFYALHDHSKTDPAKANGWNISRYRYFFYVFVGSFVWYWFPGWIAQFLSVFTIACWIRPNNVVINQVFGGWSGLSLIPITFDWTQITGYIQSPLVSPWHAIGNVLIGLIFFIWIVASGIHFSGAWYGAYLPISDSSSYDNTGGAYNVSRILTPEYTLDLAKYEAYSPLFLSTTFALLYGLSFAAISAVIVHTALFHGADIWARVKTVRGDDDDVHTRMMRKYPEAPNWWYMSILVVMLAVGLVTSLAYDTHLSWWAFLIAGLISLLWTVPIGMIQATTNIQLGLNVFTGTLVSLGVIHLLISIANIHYRIHHWLYATWSSSGHDDVQNLWIYHDGSSPDLCPRFEARPLHEGSSSDDVWRPSCCNHLGFFCADFRSSMGPEQYRGRLFQTSKEQLHLPQRSGVFQRISHLGTYWPCAHLFTG